MLTRNEQIILEELDYFDIFLDNESQCTLHSKYTGHDWIVIDCGYYCRIEHRHCQTEKYHRQCYAATPNDALLEIACHEDFQLNHRRNRRKKETPATKLWDRLVNLT